MNGNFEVGSLVCVNGMKLEDVGIVFKINVVSAGWCVLVVKVNGVEEGGVDVIDF